MGLRNLIETQIKKGMSQRILAQRIGVSHGTINNILAGIIPTRTTTLDKFAEFFHVSVEALRHDGGSHIAEPVAPYTTPTKLERLMTLAKHLDHDELATLERCAEAFRAEEPEVRQHLIGQLKIIERLVNPEQVPPAKEKKRNTSPS